MTAGPTAEGDRRALVVADAAGAWAWAGLRLAARRGIAATHAYLELPAAERDQRIARTEAAWLTSQWTTEDQARFDLRYLTVPEVGRLDCAVLVRVGGATGESALDAARRRLDALSAVPPHVRAEPIGSTAEVRDWLVPFDPHPQGSIEVRKRIDWAPVSRPDTGRAVGVAFGEFGGTGAGTGRTSWEPLFRALAELPFRVLLSICFVPFSAVGRFQADLAGLAAEYAALAAPLTTSPLFSRSLPPDPFAVDAAPGYARARRLYSGLCYRVRISLAAERQLPRYVAELLTAAVSPGGGAVALSPTPEELPTVRANLGALNTDWLAVTSAQGVPLPALGPAERVLTDLADPGQAASVLRLPAEWPGHEELFVSERPEPVPADPWEDPDPVPDDDDPLLARNRFDPSEPA